jgi:hypothetical protein
MRSDFTRYLDPLPDQPLFIQDDVEAQGIALVCGLVGPFRKPDRSPMAAGWIDALPYTNHPTHWIFVIRYMEFPDAADNGWSVAFFPKVRVTIEDAEAMIRIES